MRLMLLLSRAVETAAAAAAEALAVAGRAGGCGRATGGIGGTGGTGDADDPMVDSDMVAATRSGNGLISLAASGDLEGSKFWIFNFNSNADFGALSDKRQRHWR